MLRVWDLLKGSKNKKKQLLEIHFFEVKKTTKTEFLNWWLFFGIMFGACC